MRENRRKISPRLFSIPPAAPFLSTLVDALLSGNLIDGFKPDADPLALSGVTIYVPTRRAARALQAEFVARINNNALLLPKILPLGDIEEDQFIFEQQADSALDLDPTISNLERQLLLTKMIDRWSSVLEKSSLKLFGDEALAVPASISDAAWLANDLASLMDTVSTEEADWSRLDELVPNDHSDWWQLTLEFLKIATQSWPLILQEKNAMDVASKRGLLLHRQAEHYNKFGSKGPVIAAGSTGSIPATAALLGSIAHMEKGAVILPGLDRDIPDHVWQGLSQAKSNHIDIRKRVTHQQAAAPGHPQYGLKKLIDGMAVERNDVTHISGVDDSSIGYARLRESIVSLSMEPSETTDNWPEFRDRFSNEKSELAFSGVSLIEADGERHEALSIALAMREILEVEGKTGALVTPDRVLARRVSVELKRFGIEIDDSAGIPLSETLPGSFTRLVFAIALEQADPVALLSLIKHPFASFGLSKGDLFTAQKTLELNVIRGNIADFVPGHFKTLAQKAKAKLIEQKKLINEDEWPLALELAGAMDKALAPLHALLAAQDPVCLGHLVKTSIEALDGVARNKNGDGNAHYHGDAGEALCKFLGDLMLASSESDIELELPARGWPSFYEALLGSRPVRLHRNTHSRLSILGPLEARLQQANCIILGGLNEGKWPAATNNDPFLNRPMKATLSLEPPERRIGLAAHDFQMLMGSKEVILTRTKRADNAPTVASRWVQRLLTLAGKNAADAMRLSGQKYLDWANQIDHRPIGDERGLLSISRPEPKPPVKIRPNRIRVTEVETWIRDPYAIYAKYVLGLKPLEQIRREIDARERGILYHAIFEKLCRNWLETKNRPPLDLALEIGKIEFAKLDLPQDIVAFWWPRYLEIASEFINWETERRSGIVKSDVELKAQLEIGSNGFMLRGVADRIDQLSNGGHAIIDYKTGANPSVSQANSLLAPQLPLEGAMALRGAFKNVKASNIDSLAYVRLRPAGGFKVEALGVSRNAVDPHQLSEDALAALTNLVCAYENPEKGYISRARPFKQGDISGDYDHLARVMEWSLDDGNDEGEL